MKNNWKWHRWSLETFFVLQKLFCLSPLLKSARIQKFLSSWPVQVGTCIINACVNLQKPTLEVATLHPGWISELLTAQLWPYCVKQFRFKDIFHGKELEAFRDTLRLFYLCPFIQQGKIQPMSYLGRLGYVKQIDSWLFRKGHGNWGTTAWIRLLKWSHHVLSEHGDF